MSRFEQRLGRRLEDPEFRAGYEEMEQDLRAHYEEAVVRFIYTIEFDDDDPGLQHGGVYACRHRECATRHDHAPNFVTVEAASIPETEWNLLIHDYECWGCVGWLVESPLTPAETAEKMRLAREDS